MVIAVPLEFEPAAEVFPGCWRLNRRALDRRALDRRELDRKTEDLRRNKTGAKCRG